MVIYLLIYFLAGILQDFLFTLNLRYVSQNNIILAMFFSFLTTVVSLTVLYNIVTNLDPNKSIVAIIVYAAGITVGTMLGMKFKPGFKK